MPWPVPCPRPTRFFECFDYLWIDSGEFEAWAKAQLEDPASPVNTRGREAASKLDAHRRTYYWWFQDFEATELQPIVSCISLLRSSVT